MTYFQSFLQYINKFLSLTPQKKKKKKKVCAHANMPVTKLMSRNIVTDTCLQIRSTLIHLVHSIYLGPC